MNCIKRQLLRFFSYIFYDKATHDVHMDTLDAVELELNAMTFKINKIDQWAAGTIRNNKAYYKDIRAPKPKVQEVDDDALTEDEISIIEDLTRDNDLSDQHLDIRLDGDEEFISRETRSHQTVESFLKEEEERLSIAIL